MSTDLTLDLREDMPTLPDLPTFEAETIRTHEEHGYLARWFGTKAHQGTHVDAPAHYVENGRTVDQIPLSTLWGPASVLDVRDASGGAVTESDLDAAAPASLSERVILVTGDVDRYFESAAHLTEEAATWLLDRDVSLVAVDHLTDDPDDSTRPVHNALLGADVPIVEYLANTDEIVTHSTVAFCCLPLRLAGFEASPVRAVARTDDGAN
ncbi:cyclase family protein [Halovenus marina]|uniref:cyclase family protein n=1 Tax=Halovenus marina TaxID=3396621 RepID=UPI003F57E7C0